MNGILKAIKQNPLKIVTILAFIYPVLPLSVYAVIGSIVGFEDLFIGRRGFLSSNFDVRILLAYFWFLGGVAGLVGALLVMFNRRKMKSLILISSGLISYLILLFMINPSKNLSFFNVLHTCYLVFVAIVVLIHIVQIAKDLYHQRLPFLEINLEQSETSEIKNGGREG